MSTFLDISLFNDVFVLCDNRLVSYCDHRLNKLFFGVFSLNFHFHLKPGQHQQQCRSDRQQSCQLLRQSCFDVVAGVDPALQRKRAAGGMAAVNLLQLLLVSI